MGNGTVNRRKGHMGLAAKRKKGEALQGASLPLGLGSLQLSPKEPTTLCSGRERCGPQGRDEQSMVLPSLGASSSPPPKLQKQKSKAYLTGISQSLAKN